MYTVTRQIGIDAGHRVTTHGSKCRNLHGHRYTIEATCQARDVNEDGEQTGMVLDFGFLKDEMMLIIDEDCDHGFMIWVDDTALMKMFANPSYSLSLPSEAPCLAWKTDVRAMVASQGWWAGLGVLDTKVYVLDCIPTAENLARHWFNRLHEGVTLRSGGFATLTKIRVHETPNCFADYEPIFTP